MHIEIPDTYRRPLRDYVMTGRIPDSPVLRALICCDIKEACQRVNDVADVKSLLDWLWHCAPMYCWGTETQMQLWASLGGAMKAANSPTIAESKGDPSWRSVLGPLPNEYTGPRR